MNHIVILVGGRNAGKSSILRSLCCVELNQTLKQAKRFLYLNFSDKKVLTFILSSSPQEKLPFCNFERVIKRLHEFILNKEISAASKFVSNYVILIAFTLQVNRTNELGEDCMTKPFEFLKGLPDYKVHVAHVKKDDIPSASRINSFISQNMNPELTLISEETARGRQDNNARRLKEFIGRL